MSPAPHVPAAHRPRGIDFLYEDRDVIVIEKAAGILTTATRRGEAFTAEGAVTDYLRKGCARSRRRAFPVHRLDRDTSGLLLFAKSEEAQERIKERWAGALRLYLAIVEGHLKEREGLFESFLAEDEDLYVRTVRDGRPGKLARTQYRVIREAPFASAVKVRLLTGRKNQIRVHFAEAGHPVAGDAKYGAGPRRRPARLLLHAKEIAFDQPFTGERLSFESPIPREFLRAVRGLGEGDWKEAGI